MTIRTLFGVALACAAPLLAQPDVPLPPPPATDHLETLVSPIALYPDPLVSLILPAATLPGDIALAARFTAANSDPAAIDAQTWDESVKSLAHYPELLTWLDQNLEWTKQLGAAFVTQPTEVMNTIQRLRQRARDAGVLVDTPEQRVVVQQNYVYLVPAQPDVIYVPSYDPEILYYSSYSSPRPRATALSFGTAFSTGPWLAFEPDWSRRSIWIDRRVDWSRRDWRPEPPTNIVVSADRQAWRPRADAVSRATANVSSATSSSVTINHPVSNQVNNNTTPTRVEVARPTPFVASISAPAAPGRAEAASSTERTRAAQRAPRPAAPESPSIAAPPTPALPPAASSEPALTPTGRMTPIPRAQSSPRTEAVSPPTEAVAPPTDAVPVPPAARDARGRDVPTRGPDLRNDRGPRVPTSAPQIPTALPPTPKGKVPPPVVNPVPPPNAKSDQPPPKSKAKSRDQDDDEETPPSRGK